MSVMVFLLVLIWVLIHTFDVKNVTCSFQDKKSSLQAKNYPELLNRIDNVSSPLRHRAYFPIFQGQSSWPQPMQHRVIARRCKNSTSPILGARRTTSVCKTSKRHLLRPMRRPTWWA